MTHRDLAAILTRITGIGIGLQLLVSTGQWLANHSSDPLGPLTLPLLALFASWVALAAFLFKKPHKIAALFVPAKRPDNQLSLFAPSLQQLERLLICLLGLFFLLLAAIDLSEVIAYQVSYQNRVRTFPDTLWFETAASFNLSLVSVSAKTLVGLVLIMGARTAGKLLCWARTAGRNWDLD